MRENVIISDEYLHSKLCLLISKLIATEGHVIVPSLKSIKVQIQRTHVKD